MNNGYVGTFEKVEGKCPKCASTRNVRRALTAERYPVGTVVCMMCDHVIGMNARYVNTEYATGWVSEVPL